MTKMKLERPVRKIDAAYNADFYCKWHNRAHVEDDFPFSVEAQSWGEAIKKARDNGWIVHRDHTATCPKCVAAMRQTPEQRSFEPVLDALDEKLPDVLSKYARSPKAREAIEDIANVLRQAMQGSA